MTRWLVAFACVFALALTVSAGTADAKRSKMCAMKTMDGKQTKWKCKAAQKCCFDWLMNKGSCVGANDICL